MKRVFAVLLSLTLLMGLPAVAPYVTAAENLAVNGDLELGTANGWETDNADRKSVV